MPLSDSSLGGKIKNEIIAAFGAADDDAKLTKFANAIAKAVVSEITSNAIVTTSGTVSSGSGSGGSVATTGTVT